MVCQGRAFRPSTPNTGSGVALELQPLERLFVGLEGAPALLDAPRLGLAIDIHADDRPTILGQAPPGGPAEIHRFIALLVVEEGGARLVRTDLLRADDRLDLAHDDVRRGYLIGAVAIAVDDPRFARDQHLDRLGDDERLGAVHVIREGAVHLHRVHHLLASHEVDHPDRRNRDDREDYHRSGKIRDEAGEHVHLPGHPSKKVQHHDARHRGESHPNDGVVPEHGGGDEQGERDHAQKDEKRSLTQPPEYLAGLIGPLDSPEELLLEPLGDVLLSCGGHDGVIRTSGCHDGIGGGHLIGCGGGVGRNDVVH